MASNIRFEFDHHEVSFKKFKLMISDDLILATVNNIVEIAESELGQVRCPVHDKAPQITVCLMSSGDLNVHTASCCEEFTKTTTMPLLATFHQTAYFKPGGRLMVLPEGATRPYVFNEEDIETLILGRSDTDIDYQPDIDLCKYGALKHGVSRRHAAIRWHRGALHITDEGSSNGTFIYDEKLKPHEPYILHDDDEVKLGHLSMKVMLLDGEE